ncbi:MAG: type II toxin-antitoxin system Phd/YefM family antitoxin [candidate division Zixibacteria bacterium]|nr:type II toxin-antitoxin system Phd/YefM family antitoxin [candidate division Zixibacteria bacterium]
MKTVNIHEAKTHFSRLLSEAGSGEEIIIAKSGKPVARLIPFEKKPAKRVPGSAKRKISLSADFLKPLPDDLLETFEK